MPILPFQHNKKEKMKTSPDFKKMALENASLKSQVQALKHMNDGLQSGLLFILLTKLGGTFDLPFSYMEQMKSFMLRSESDEERGILTLKIESKE